MGTDGTRCERRKRWRFNTRTVVDHTCTGGVNAAAGTTNICVGIDAVACVAGVVRGVYVLVVWSGGCALPGRFGPVSWRGSGGSGGGGAPQWAKIVVSRRAGPPSPRRECGRSEPERGAISETTQKNEELDHPPRTLFSAVSRGQRCGRRRFLACAGEVREGREGLGHLRRPRRRSVDLAIDFVETKKLFCYSQ